MRCLHRGRNRLPPQRPPRTPASAVERAIQEAETRRTRRLTEETAAAERTTEPQPGRAFPATHVRQRPGLQLRVLQFHLRARPRDRNHADCGYGTIVRSFRENVPNGYRADDRQVMKHGTTRVLDERYAVAGREQWIHTVKIPYHDQHGEIIGVIGMLRGHFRAQAGGRAT